MSEKLPKDFKSSSYPFQIHTSSWIREIERLVTDLPELRLLKLYFLKNHSKIFQLTQSFNVFNDAGAVILRGLDNSGKIVVMTCYPFLIKKRLFRSPKIIWLDVTSEEYRRFSWLYEDIDKYIRTKLEK
ncbi:MAG: hypothetical protein ACFFDT_00285 [Candidatus Hodarchaeota archaeon]